MKKILESVDDLLLGTGHTPALRKDRGTEIGRQSERIEKDLLKIQEALARLSAAVTEDPVLGVEAAPLRNALIEQRAKKLEAWGAMALKWFLKGGRIKFVNDEGGTEVVEWEAGRALAERRQSLATSSGMWRRGGASDEFDARALQAALGPRWDSPSDRPTRELNPVLLQEILDTVGEPPGELDSDTEAIAEVQSLVHAMEPERLASWRTMPREVQRCLVGLLVARARHIQDEMVAPLRSIADPNDQLAMLFSTMTGYSKQEQPGFVFGLQRSHRPETGHWYNDAFLWWKQLQAFLRPTSSSDALPTSGAGSDASVDSMDSESASPDSP
jgi:hypothetical protein